MRLQDAFAGTSANLHPLVLRQLAHVSQYVGRRPRQQDLAAGRRGPRLLFVNDLVSADRQPEEGTQRT